MFEEGGGPFSIDAHIFVMRHAIKTWSATNHSLHILFVGISCSSHAVSILNQVSSRVEYPEDFHTFSEEDRRDFRYARYGMLPDLFQRS